MIEAVRRAGDAWFKPKPFESEALYERLGVRFFSKFVPNNGEWVRRHVFKSNRVNLHDHSVKSAENGTRFAETMHLAEVVAIEYVGILTNNVLASSAINLIWNLYPIMLQRYLRIRFTNALNRMEQRARLTTAAQS